MIRGILAAGAAAALALCSIAQGQATELFVIDFEDLAEGIEISDQFAAFGATFSIEGDRTLWPIIAVEGNPVVAFNGSGADMPMSSGLGGLTDPVIGGDPFIGNNIRITFDPPVTSARLFVVDIESPESITVDAFDGAVLVDTETHAGGESVTGNGKSTEYFLSAASITDLLVTVPAPPTVTGYAIDFLSFTRPCEAASCGPRVRVSQETSPGAGDFLDNTLGEMLAFPFGGATSQFYAYGVPEGSSWNGQSLAPVADRSHLLISDTSEGLSLVVVHDRAIPDDPDGGVAETRVEVIGDPDGAVRTVEDEPAGAGDDVYTGAPGDSVFTARHLWLTCCTDGLAISDLACGASVIMSFTDVDGNPNTLTLAGLSEWVAYSADGNEIPLVLEVDRRVRLDLLPPESCPADFNCDNVVNAADLALLLDRWGPNRGDVTDLNNDGDVGPPDLAQLLEGWGLCP